MVSFPCVFGNQIISLLSNCKIWALRWNHILMKCLDFLKSNLFQWPLYYFLVSEKDFNLVIPWSHAFRYANKVNERSKYVKYFKIVYSMTTRFLFYQKVREFPRACVRLTYSVGTQKCRQVYRLISLPFFHWFEWKLVIILVWLSATNSINNFFLKDKWFCLNK